MIKFRVGLLALLAGLSWPCVASAQEHAPRVERIAAEDGRAVEAHIFEPEARRASPRSAIVLLHGGGWVAGDASWVYPRAQRFAEAGAIAVAVEYRLGDPRGATAEAQAIIRWLRANANVLNLDPARIAAYGVSAGGQLSVSAAQSEDANARPNAIVMVSPALDLERDGWFARLTGSAETAREFSPLANVRAGQPPTLILQGDVDTETPLRGARAFCEAVRAHNDLCVLKVYVGYGHLFTPAGINDRDTPQPDPTISAQAADLAEAFLRSQGFFQ